MATTMTKLAELIPTDDIRDPDAVHQIAAAFASIDADEVPWDEQPAIIIDTDDHILDGHHRVAGALEAGLDEWRAIRVDADRWSQLVDEKGHRGACMLLADEIGDSVTWGAVAN